MIADPYRLVRTWRLWESLPRTDRLVAHLERDGWRDTTRCGQAIQGRYTVVHQTVAEAIGADMCKACLRGYPPT